MLGFEGLDEHRADLDDVARADRVEVELARVGLLLRVAPYLAGPGQAVLGRVDGDAVEGAAGDPAPVHLHSDDVRAVVGVQVGQGDGVQVRRVEVVQKPAHGARAEVEHEGVRPGPAGFVRRIRLDEVARSR